MGDCVEVLLAGSGKDEVTKGYAEILWLWRSAAAEEEVGRDGGREGGGEGGKGLGSRRFSGCEIEERHVT
jgi:hypothetical protein